MTEKHNTLPMTAISGWTQRERGKYNLTFPDGRVVAVVYDYDHVLQIIEALDAASRNPSLLARAEAAEAALAAIVEETRIVSIIPAGFPDCEFPQEIQDLRHIRTIAVQALAGDLS